MDKIYNIIFDLIEELTGETVIFENSNAPRDKLPYWTILINQNVNIGAFEHSNAVDNDGNMPVKTECEATAYLKRYGADSYNKVLEFSINVINLSVLQKFFHKNKIVLWDRSNVMDISEPIDKLHYESRAAVDLSLRFSLNALDNVGVIEKVNVKNEFVKD